MAQKENKLILYKDEEGKLSVNTLFADEDVWLTQDQLAEIYQTTQENISMHISNIYADDAELSGMAKRYITLTGTSAESAHHLDSWPSSLSDLNE